MACTVEAFVSIGNTEPTAADFFIHFGSTSITEFSVTRQSQASEIVQGVHEFTFTAPTDLQTGPTKLLVGLIDESYKNASFEIRIESASTPSLDGLLNPTSCYTQGGDSISGTIKGLPLSSNISAYLSWGDTSNVSANSVVVSTSGSSKDVQVTSLIPASQKSSGHTESVSVVFYSALPEITVTTAFQYRKLPIAGIANMNVSEVAYTGGTYVQLTVRNLGPRSAESELIVLMATQFKATVVSTTCKADANKCAAGLVECEVVVITPQMTSLAAMGSLLLQVYWSTLGVVRAASSEALQVYNPDLPTIPGGSTLPEEGYTTETTEVKIQVYEMTSAGQYFNGKDSVYAYLTQIGSTSQTEVEVKGSDLITSSTGDKRNEITLTMPTYTNAERVEITVQLVQAPSVKASTYFVYHAIPTTAPQILGSQTTGPLTGGTTIFVQLTSFYVCPLATDVVVEFDDLSLSRYKWAVNWVSSSYQKTSMEVTSPLIEQHSDVYNNSTTGVLRDLKVRVYPLKLAAHKFTYGAAIQFKYKSNAPMITELSPSTGLVVGGIPGKLLLENVVGIAQAEQLTISFGSSVVPTSDIVVNEKLNGHVSLEFTVPSGSIGLAAVLVTFTNGQSSAACNPTV